MESAMAETASDGADVSEKSLPETARSDGVEPQKKCVGGEGPSELNHKAGVGEFRISDAEEEKHETLEKDQVEGVRENSAAESNGEEEREVKVTEGGKEVMVKAIVPADEVAVVNHEGRKEVAVSTIAVADEVAVDNHKGRKEVVVGMIVPVDEVAAENYEVEASPSRTPSSDRSAASAARGLSSVSSPNKQEQRSLSRIVEGMSVSPAVKTPTRDGYNWRKYGQKQVKSPKGSRSYYRCTYSDCCAKKIECSNDSGDVIEVVNKGSHSHEPPRKNNYSMRESRIVSSTPSVSEDRAAAAAAAAAAEEPIKPRCRSEPSTSVKENICESHTMAERKRPSSSVSDGNGEIEAKENGIEEPEAKRRLKKDRASCSDSVSKPGKKHRFVVHAAGDVGISGDGYRWRKYGQKMVKGNPNPRNYYRCTSAGCPVRKHIETAVDNTTAVIITYKGVHNHDMPVPKKRHGLPSAPLVAAAAPTSMNSSQSRAGEPMNPQPQVNSSSQCSVGEMSSEALDIGNEKAMESARTLLSIGFEIKQC